MTPHLMKLLGLSAALLAISQGVRAAEVQAPSFTAEPCCQLCPEAHDASRYVTRYQQNFTTLVRPKATGCSVPAKTCAPSSTPPRPATNACNRYMTRSRNAAWNWCWCTSQPVAW